jgi:hypothetical protein
MTAISSCPEFIRQIVSDLSDKELQDAYRDAQKAGDTASICQNKAQMAGHSVASSARFQPWHILMTDEERSECARRALDENDIEGARLYLFSLNPHDTFVMASPGVRRDEYIKGVATLLDSHRVRSLVLDASVVSQDSVLDIAVKTGIMGLHIDFAKPAEAMKRSSMRINPIAMTEAGVILSPESLAEGADAAYRAASKPAAPAAKRMRLG